MAVIKNFEEEKLRLPYQKKKNVFIIYIYKSYLKKSYLSLLPFGKSCSPGRPYVLFVLCLFVILIISVLVLRAGFGF